MVCFAREADSNLSLLINHLMIIINAIYLEIGVLAPEWMQSWRLIDLAPLGHCV